MSDAENTQHETMPRETVLEDHTLVLQSRSGEVMVDSVLDSTQEQTRAFAAAVIITGAVLVASTVSWFSAEHLPLAGPVTDLRTVVTPNTENPLLSVDIEARAAVVYDVRTGKVLYARNEAEVRPLASLTKMMTGLLAYEEGNPDADVTISPSAIQAEGDSGLLAQETWRLSDLVSFLMMTSSNDGANAVAMAVGSVDGTTANTSAEYAHVDKFVERMNRRASTLGLMNTTYRNPSGLDSEQYGYGGTGTAEDVARLVAHVWNEQPEVFRDTAYYSRSFESTTGFIHEAVNTNEYVLDRPGMLGSKTGYTDEAGGNLAIIYDAGMDHPIVVVVLGSSVDGRFTDVSALADATNTYISSGWYEHDMAGTTPFVQS